LKNLSKKRRQEIARKAAATRKKNGTDSQAGKKAWETRRKNQKKAKSLEELKVDILPSLFTL